MSQSYSGHKADTAAKSGFKLLRYHNPAESIECTNLAELRKCLAHCINVRKLEAEMTE